MWCTQCKQEKPADQFLTLKRRGWKVEKCNECAQANMLRYTRYVEMDPNKVKAKGGDE